MIKKTLLCPTVNNKRTFNSDYCTNGLYIRVDSTWTIIIEKRILLHMYSLISCE